MWDYPSIYGKAQQYFGRADAHPRTDDDEFALWALLGLEFLLRAPLARIHGSLLAEPDGDSLLSANGVQAGAEPRSVGIQTVIKRLRHVVPGFTDDRAKDATFLMNLRNAELHSGEAALASVSHEAWLPRLYRVADVLAAHLRVDLNEVLGEQVATQAGGLVDAQDKQLQHEVNRRKNEARKFFEGLQDDEVAARQPDLSQRWRMPDNKEIVACPACGNETTLQLSHVRRTNERIEDDVIYSDDIYISQSLACGVCGLVLSSTAEVAAAGLNQLFSRVQEESVEDRFMNTYQGEEYGND